MRAGVGRQRGRRQLRVPLRDAFFDCRRVRGRVPALLPPLQRRHQAGAVAASTFTVPSPRELHRRRRIAARVASTASSRRESRIDGVESPRESHRRRRVAQPEFGAGGPYRWYVAAVGAYFYCQLAVNFVVFAAFVDTRCKHHNILVVNRVDLCGNQIYGAFVLNRRVDLHTIDATPARWRGDVGSSPLDGASAATSSP